MSDHYKLKILMYCLKKAQEVEALLDSLIANLEEVSEEKVEVDPLPETLEGYVEDFKWKL